MEVAINNQNEPPSLLKQAANPPGHWVILKLEGMRSNRSGIGARVKIVAGDHAQYGEVRSGGSYLSQSDLRLHFGLGSAAMIERIEIAWPSGIRQVLQQQAVDRVLTIGESAP